MIAFLMMLANLATPGLPKIKAFLNTGSEVKIFANNVTKKTLSPDSNNIVDLLMWPKFGMREVIIIYKDLTRQTDSFEGWSWFQFNNLGLALVMGIDI